MNARRFAFPVLSVLFAALGSSSWAWGPVGHKAVGMIAQSRLSPQTLQAIQAILGPDVSLDKIANCPDQFVFTKDPNCAGVFTMSGDPAATKNWHFINFPIIADASSMMSYCPQDDCVVAQIPKDVAVLKDPAASLQDKRMALTFLVHFVGDVHQPLHSATDFPDDSGGNFKWMHAIQSVTGKQTNLHSIWDDEIDDPAKVDYRLPDSDLTAQAERIAGSLAGGPPDTASWTTAGDIAAAAALESQEIAKTVIYPAYRASFGNDKLADYQAKMQPIAYRRIQLAGVRLAALLEQAFAVAPSSSVPSSAPSLEKASRRVMSVESAALP
jgi:hypothetical protein